MIRTCRAHQPPRRR